MRQTRNIIWILALFLLATCIKPYDPLIESDVQNKYVVTGRVTDQEGWQEVNVSLSSPVEIPEYLPVSGCRVNILNDKGNIFSMAEFDPGNYRVWIGQENLARGTAYWVTVITPGGEELVSGSDTMQAGPPLDSLYYAIEDLPTNNPEVYHRVMQFYVDLNAEGDFSQYYKWEITETWEYHAAHVLEYYYDGDWHQVYPPDSTNRVCWSTLPVKNVYTISTKSLSQNYYIGYPLHYVDASTSRLKILYSILVNQLALSERAYNYWEQLRINSTEQGGLYEKQPLAIKGNLVNVTSPEKEVLGYFYTASESSRRYFFEDIEELNLDTSFRCTEEPLGRMGWKEFRWYDYPVYYYYDIWGRLWILDDVCVDCRLMGGTTTKPDFWPL